MKVVALILLLGVAQVYGRALLEAEADCGSDVECKKPISPKFKVIGHERGTEIREYENGTWAVSFGKSIFGPDVAAIVATKGLVGYFAGANNEHLKLRPSIPVVTTILKPPPHPHHGKHDKNGSHPHPPHPPKNGSHPHPPHPPKNGSHPGPHHPPHHPPGPIVTSTAFLGSKGKGKFPVPDDKRVKLLYANTTKVYSHEFGGFALSWFIKREIDHLKKDLKSLGVKPCKGEFLVAVYDGPFKLFNRKNEVWWTSIPGKHHKKDEEMRPDELPVEPKEMPERFGFDQFDPVYAFPEEVDQPPQEEEAGLPEDLPKPEIEEPLMKDAGEWTQTTGRDIIEEAQRISENARSAVDGGLEHL